VPLHIFFSFHHQSSGNLIYKGLFYELSDIIYLELLQDFGGYVLIRIPDFIE